MANPYHTNQHDALHYDTSYWINGLDLIPHPEGGFYRQTYRSLEVFESLREGTSRSLSTSIYFLLTRDNVSHLHRELLQAFPAHRETIEMLTPNP